MDDVLGGSASPLYFFATFPSPPLFPHFPQGSHAADGQSMLLCRVCQFQVSADVFGSLIQAQSWKPVVALQ